ncbi:MAG: hypothetical protein RL215_341 [Planctomycetota bacterium]
MGSASGDFRDDGFEFFGFAAVEFRAVGVLHVSVGRFKEAMDFGPSAASGERFFEVAAGFKPVLHGDMDFAAGGEEFRVIGEECESFFDEEEGSLVGVEFSAEDADSEIIEDCRVFGSGESVALFEPVGGFVVACVQNGMGSELVQDFSGVVVASADVEERSFCLSGGRMVEQGDACEAICGFESTGWDRSGCVKQWQEQRDLLWAHVVKIRDPVIRGGSGEFGSAAEGVEVFEAGDSAKELFGWVCRECSVGLFEEREDFGEVFEYEEAFGGGAACGGGCGGLAGGFERTLCGGAGG